MQPQIITSRPKQSASTTRRRHAISKSISAGPVALTFMAIMAVFIVGIGYLYIESNLTTRGYEMRDLEKQIDALKQEHKKLQIESAQTRSIQELQKAATEKLNMVQIAEIHYLERTDSTVAISNGSSRNF